MRFPSGSRSAVGGVAPVTRGTGDARAAAGLGVVRVIVGVGMLADPPRLARLLGIDRVTAGSTGWLTAMVGGREVALGVGSLAAAGRGSATADWLLAQAVADLTDAAAIAAAVRRGRVSAPLGGLIVAAGLGGATFALLAARR